MPQPFSLDTVVRPSVTVDVVVLTLLEGRLAALVIRRGAPPFEGALALPGGFVKVGDAKADKGESVVDAAARELHEETGLPPSAVHLEHLAAFGKPGRDPRTRVISVAYFALVRPEVARFVRPGTDAATAFWMDVDELTSSAMAFDHADILAAALARMRDLLPRSSIALHLVPEVFTIPELRRVHEALTAHRLDPANFHRRFLRLLEQGVVEEAPGRRVGGKKAARVFRFRREDVTSGRRAEERP